MAKKKNELSFEEKLQNALVPEEEQPYEIPDNWVWTRLGDVFEWGSGGTPSRKEKENFEGKIPWFKTGELNNEYLYNSEERITQRALDNSSAKLYPPNTVIMAMYGATIGKLGILSVDGTTNQACACAKPNKYVLVKYLFFYLMSRRGDFIKKGKGGAQPNISLEIIKEYKFPLPPFQEQQRIIEHIESLFSKLDEAKDKIQMALDSFETRKSAILYQAFSGELTKKWREENGIKFKYWNKVKLREICQINPKKISTKILNDTMDITFLPMASVSDKFGEISMPLIKKLGEYKKGYTNFEQGDILFAKITPCMENGKIAVVGKLKNNIGFGSTEFYVLRCNKLTYNRFIYHWLRWKKFREEAKSVMSGAVGQQRVPRSFLEEYQISLPSLEEQKEIVRILDTIFNKEQNTQQLIDLIEKIDLMKKSILARAFRGELGTNIPEEESAMELLKSVLEV